MKVGDTVYMVEQGGRCGFQWVPGTKATIGQIDKYDDYTYVHIKFDDIRSALGYDHVWAGIKEVSLENPAVPAGA